MIGLVLSASVVSFVLTLAIPVVTAIVTKAQADARIKAVVTLVLAAIVTLISGAVDNTGQAVLSGPVLWDWLITTAVAVAAYVGIYKPIGQINDRLLPSFGLGRST